MQPIFRFLLSVVVVVLAHLAGVIIGSIAGTERIADLVYRLVTLFLVTAGFFLLLKGADDVDGNPLASMGLSLEKPWIADAVRGIAFGFVLIFLAYLVISFTCDVTANIFINLRAAERLVVELIVLSAGAMLEEVVFRGYPLQRLISVFQQLTKAVSVPPSLGSAFAIVLWSAGAFGSLHFWNPNATAMGVVNTMLVGVLLGLVYLRTGSLWMPWGIHFAWNTTLGVLLGLPVSGLTQFGVIVRSKAVGPLWITGGRYGIEGSALGTAVIVIGILIVLVLVKPRTMAGLCELAPGTDISAPHQISPESIQQ